LTDPAPRSSAPPRPETRGRPRLFWRVGRSRPIWSASPASARHGSGESLPRCRGWSAETPLPWPPIRPPATPSGPGARRWATRPASTAGAHSGASTLTWTNSARPGFGNPGGGCVPTVGGRLPGFLSCQGASAGDGQAEAGGAASALAGGDS